MKKIYIAFIALFIYSASAIKTVDDLPAMLDYGTGTASKDVLNDKDYVIFFTGAS